MERLVEKKYTMLEYNTVLSIIYNIIIGLETYKNYDYIPENIIVQSNKDIEEMKQYLSYLKCKVNFSEKNIELSDQDIKIINKIFEKEYSYKYITYRIWKTEIEKENILIVHMCQDDENIEYILDTTLNTRYQAISNCVYDGNFNKLYGNSNHSYGIVYDFNFDSFIGACEIDAQLEGINYDNLYENKRSPFTVKMSNPPINSTILTFTNNYQMTLTKTPYSLLNLFQDGINQSYSEIGLDKKYTRPLKIIYFKENNPNIEEKVKEIANKLNIKIDYLPKEEVKKNKI